MLQNAIWGNFYFLRPGCSAAWVWHPHLLRRPNLFTLTWCNFFKMVSEAVLFRSWGRCAVVIIHFFLGSFRTKNTLFCLKKWKRTLGGGECWPFPRPIYNFTNFKFIYYDHYRDFIFKSIFSGTGSFFMFIPSAVVHRKKKNISLWFYLESKVVIRISSTHSLMEFK